MTTVMGVDPGVNGGITLLYQSGAVLYVEALKPDMTEDTVVTKVTNLCEAMRVHESRICFFEKVQHMTGDGGKGSHTFGYIKGLLRGCLKTNGMILVDVYPVAWQSALECLSGGDKNVTKRRAAELFPDIKWTHNTADSALIAEYGRRRLSL